MTIDNASIAAGPVVDGLAVPLGPAGLAAGANGADIGAGVGIGLGNVSLRL